MHLPELAAVGTLGFARRARDSEKALYPHRNRLRSGQAQQWARQTRYGTSPSQQWHRQATVDSRLT